MKDGLKIESAASVVARDMITKHMRTFAHVVQRDRAASASVVAAYIDGLAGAVALTIAGGLGSKDDITMFVVGKLTEAIERDLRHLLNGRTP